MLILRAIVRFVVNRGIVSCTATGSTLVRCSVLRAICAANKLLHRTHTPFRKFAIRCAHFTANLLHSAWSGE